MAYEYDFQERMEAGRQVSLDRRNKGLPSGKPAAGWSKRKPLPDDTAENRLYSELADLRRQLGEAQNEIAQYKAGTTASDLDDFGAEFDKLAGRQDCRPAAPIIADHTCPRGRHGMHTMNEKQYIAALKKLGLTPASKKTAAVLGIGVRHSQRIAAGETPVTPTLANLIQQYLEHGLPDDDE